MKTLVILFILTQTFISICFAKVYLYSQNKSNLNEATEETLLQMLKGNKSYWKSGERIKLCHLEARDDSFQYILEDYLKLTADQYLNLWRRKLFTGRGFPPSLLKSNVDVIDCVNSNENSIGILPKKINLKKNLHQKEINF